MSQQKASKRTLEREERVAASMRRNLKRRKEQQRARQQDQEVKSAQDFDKEEQQCQ